MISFFVTAAGSTALKEIVSSPAFAGIAPPHTVGGPVNEPVMCYTYQEAVSAFGFSDDWEKYPLCEMIYSQFQLYGTIRFSPSYRVS